MPPPPAIRPLPTFLLPGLDGTGRMFTPLLDELSSRIDPRVLTYPHDTPLGYRELVDRLAPELPRDRPFALVGESFGGPLALELACRVRSGLVGVVLVASFVQSPLRLVPAALATEAFFRNAPPAFALRRLLTGGDAPAELVEGLAAAVRMVSPAVMARRAREVLSVDARVWLTGCSAPILYLAGLRDRLVSPATGERLKRLRPIECATVDAPHLVLQRAPAAAAEAIERFLLGALASAAGSVAARR